MTARAASSALVRSAVAARSPLIETVLTGQQWTRAVKTLPSDSALGMLRTWDVKTKKHPMPVALSSALAETIAIRGSCDTLGEGVFKILCSQSNPAHIASRISAAVAEEGNAIVECQQKLECVMTWVRSFAQSTEFTHLQVACIMIGLGFATQCRGSDASKEVIDVAIRFSESNVSAARMLIGFIAKASLPQDVEKWMLLVEKARNGGEGVHLDVRDFIPVLRLAASRGDLDNVVMQWWKWMQHTRLSLDPAVLSLVLVAHCRSQKTFEANDIVQQLCAFDAAPSIEGQIAFIRLLRSVQKPMGGYGRLLIQHWKRHTVQDSDASTDVALMMELLHLYRAELHKAEGKEKQAAVVELLKCCDCVIRYPQKLDASQLCTLLECLKENDGANSNVELKKRVISAVSQHYNGSIDAKLIQMISHLAFSVEELELVGCWLEAHEVPDEILNDALRMMISSFGEKGVTLAVALCESCNRVVPDDITVWRDIVG